MSEIAPLDQTVLPHGVRSRFVPGVNGLRVHVLEAGFEQPGRPCVLLLHGFPELAYSWRKVMMPLAEAGYHVVAPDLRGYGRTTGADTSYDTDLAAFGMLNFVRDALALVLALSFRSVAAVIGHDYGSAVAAACALVRPGVFHSVVLMSAPFAGAPAMPFDTAKANAPPAAGGPDIHAALAALDRPRKHYHWYYSTRPADDDMRNCPQGIHDFLRAYYHHKSADWPDNEPFRLTSWTAEELAKMPTYYIMDLHRTMAETVAPHTPSEAQIRDCRWLPDSELRIYSTEYARTGFQGGLQLYRIRTSGRVEAEMQLFSGRTIDVPSAFIAGKQDWGVFQNPGAADRMRESACTRMLGFHLIDGAGHWVQQEQPEQVSALLVQFLREQTQTLNIGDRD